MEAPGTIKDLPGWILGHPIEVETKQQVVNQLKIGKSVFAKSWKSQQMPKNDLLVNKMTVRHWMHFGLLCRTLVRRNFHLCSGAVLEQNRLLCLNKRYIHSAPPTHSPLSLYHIWCYSHSPPVPFSRLYSPLMII